MIEKKKSARIRPTKICERGGEVYTPSRNDQKYCSICAETVRKEQQALYEQTHRKERNSRMKEQRQKKLRLCRKCNERPCAGPYLHYCDKCEETIVHTRPKFKCLEEDCSNQVTGDGRRCRSCSRLGSLNPAYKNKNANTCGCGEWKNHGAAQCKACANIAVSGSNSVHWKGGKTTHHGYVYITVDGRRVPEHRYVWEMVNGLLDSNDIIHHINGDRTDNRIENLEKMTRAEHDAKHGRLRRHALMHAIEEELGTSRLNAIKQSLGL